MKQILLFFTLFMLCFSLQAQDNSWFIEGYVVDADTGEKLPAVTILIKGTSSAAITNFEGYFKLKVYAGSILMVSYIGYVAQEIEVKNHNKLEIKLKQDVSELQEIVVIGYGVQKQNSSTGAIKKSRRRKKSKKGYTPSIHPEDYQNESYDNIKESGFIKPSKSPLSTFSIDVDKAAYSNVRRFINNGQKPPKDAVRIEEMINYFNYNYPQPKNEYPFAIHTELSQAPWNDQNQLLHIGIQGKKIPTDNLPPSNLVFLIDVSGSMSSVNKLPLLKSAFKMLVNELRPQDQVAIVVYAGAAGQVLPATSGKQKDKILEALDQLEAGGSTAGGAGIKRAYQIAKDNFKKGGNNRVILATDGDFNVGLSSDDAMVELIEKERESGIYLTCLGFGMGNLKDSKMEKLADKGNGNYAYIDNIQEARKILVTEFGGTLFTIAKDVKIQIEFNPKYVQAYRLIGYENRLLEDEDFNDDTKDAGELGAGHTVTALYEIIPVGVKSKLVKNNVDPLKYQASLVSTNILDNQELATVKFRYKPPKKDKSELIVKPISKKTLALQETSDNFRFASAVASFGMLLRNSEFKGDCKYQLVIDLAKNARGEDEEGYRAEFIRLVKSVK